MQRNYLEEANEAVRLILLCDMFWVNEQIKSTHY